MTFQVNWWHSVAGQGLGTFVESTDLRCSANPRLPQVRQDMACGAQRHEIRDTIECHLVELVKRFLVMGLKKGGPTQGLDLLVVDDTCRAQAIAGLDYGVAKSSVP